MIHYSITPVSPEAHLYKVILFVRNPDEKGQLLALPAWIPGSYMIRDFAKNIVTLSVRCNDRAIIHTKLDKQTWKCEPCAGELVVTYEVYAWDHSVRSAHLDTTHGYFNGTSVFLRVVGQEEQPCSISIERPSGERYTDWRIATSLKPAKQFLQFGNYLADSYEDLVDHPVEMGEFSHASFQIDGTTHDIVITGRHNADIVRLCTDLEAICRSHINLFGELPTMDRYLFLVWAVGDGYGGLEHSNSTSLICSRNDLPQPNQQEVTDGYRRFLGLCSHEYFHLWNVKRIRPKVFVNTDLSAEIYTPILWAFEGITSYYDDLALVRSSRISPKSYLELLAHSITRLQKGTGRHKQTLAESSFDAWTKFYKQDENAPNAIVSYYAKGALAALALDLTIRISSAGKMSLDDVMRRLWREFGQTGIGVEPMDIERIAAEVAGCDLSDFFDRTLRSTDELPIDQLFDDVGIQTVFRAGRADSEKGGFIEREEEESEEAPPVVIGAGITSEQGDIKLSAVLDGSAAQAAGLAAGDVIVALDGIRVPSGKLDDMVARIPLGTTFTIHAFRRDELRQFQVKAQAAEPNVCYLRFNSERDDGQLDRFRRWLGIEPTIKIDRSREC